VWEVRCAYGNLVGGKKRERDHLGDQGLDGSLLLKCISKVYDVRAWIGLIWLKIGKQVGCIKNNNEPAAVVKSKEFLNGLKSRSE